MRKKKDFRPASYETKILALMAAYVLGPTILLRKAGLLFGDISKILLVQALTGAIVAGLIVNILEENP